MTEEVNQTNQESQESNDTAATQALLDAQKKAEQRKQTADESLRALRLQTCRTLLKVSLESVKLPAPVSARIEKRFSVKVDQGQPFEPAELENAIQEEQQMLSASDRCRDDPGTRPRLQHGQYRRSIGGGCR